MTEFKFNQIVGDTILSLLLSIADEKGQIFIDKTTLMPKLYRSNSETLRRLSILMNFIGNKPRKDIEDDGYDFLKNFICDSISVKSKEKIIKLFLKIEKIEGDSQGNRESLSEVLSRWEYRYEMFKFLFINRKRIDILENELPEPQLIIPDWGQDWDGKSISIVHCKCIRDVTFYDKIYPLCKKWDEILILLMGDFAKDYPDQFKEIVASSASEEDQYDVPF